MLVVDVYYSRFSLYDSRVMYRKPRFLEVLHEIREEMSREADYDVDLFTEMIRSGTKLTHGPERNVRGFKSRAPRDVETITAAPQRNRKKRARG